MGIIKPGAGIALVATLAAVALSPGSPMREDGANAAAPQQAVPVWRVLDSGYDTGCEMALAEAGPDGRLPVVLGSACAMQASLSGVRYWVDGGDDTIELSDESGAVAMRLAAGDGSAFEAFGNGAPLIMLVASGD
jgi:hypothetical protein